MRKFSAKIGVTALSVLAAFAISVSDLHAAVVNCNSRNQSLQGAVDDASDGDTITVVGTCDEIVTIAIDGITIRGGPGVGGTLMGGIIVDGVQRVVIDNLTIDGNGNTGRVDGVLVRNNGHATVRNSTIVDHTRSGVAIINTSSGLVVGNTIGNNTDYGVLVNLGSFALLRGTAENPTQTITSSSNFNCCGNALGVFNSSDGRLNGGNTIEGTGTAPAISVFGVSHVRLRNGLNTVLGTGGRAIDAGRNSGVDLRFFDVMGRIGIFTGSYAEIMKRLSDEPDPNNPPTIAGVIKGDIIVRNGAHVSFPSPFLARNGITRQGSVTVEGRLDCGGDEGHVFFSTGFGQTLATVFGAFATNPPSQCKNFNGIEVFPPPPPSP